MGRGRTAEKQEKQPHGQAVGVIPQFSAVFKGSIGCCHGHPCGKARSEKTGIYVKDFCLLSSPQSGWVSSSASAVSWAQGLGWKAAELGPVVLAACRALAGQRESLRYPAPRQPRALKMREVTLILIWGVQ